MKVEKNGWSVFIWWMVFSILVLLNSGALAVEYQSRAYYEKTDGEVMAHPLKHGDIRSSQSFEITGKRDFLESSQKKGVFEAVYIAEDDVVFSNQAVAPQNVTAVGISTDYIYLSWNEVPNASSYNVYCYWDGSYHYYDNTAYPWYWDGGNDPNTSWTYRVTAVVNGVESGFSNSSTGTTLRDGSSYLSSPSNVSAEGLTTNEVFLTWDPVVNADYYNIYWYSEGMCYFFAYTYNTSYFDSENTPGSNCMYTITAVINGAESGFSNIAEARTLDDGSGYINAPENFSVQGVSTQDIYLSWDDVTGADYYNVYCYYGGKYHWYDNTPNSFYMDDENKPGTTWNYKITAVIGGAESGFSSEASGTTLKDGANIISAPANPTATGISAQTIILTWNEVPGAECYNIYCYYYDEGKYKLYATRDDCKYLDDGNWSDQSIRYMVTAVVGNLESGFSNEVIGTTLQNGSGLIPAPSGLEVNGSGKSIYLNWNDVTGAKYYNIYWYLDGSYNWFDTTTSNYFWDDYVDQGVTYQYAVSVVKGGYESPFSSIVSGSTTGSYTLSDLTRLAKLYGVTISDRNDLNGDGIIDIYDLVLLSKRIII